MDDIDNIYNLSLNIILIYTIILKPTFSLFCNISTFIYFYPLLSQFLKGCLFRTYAKHKNTHLKKKQKDLTHTTKLLFQAFPHST